MSLSELKEMFLEIGDYLYHRYLCLDLSQYNNFSLGAKNTLIPQIIIAFVIGAIIATVLMYVEKTQTTKLIGALLRAECKDEESAKTPAELDIHMTGSLIRRMRKPSPLSKLVFYRGQKTAVSASLILQKPGTSAENQESDVTDGANTSDSMVKNGNIEYCNTRSELLKERKTLDFRTAAMYIPKELSYRAEVRYGEKPRKSVFVLSLIALPILGIVILRLLPSVLLLADGLITFFK